MFEYERTTVTEEVCSDPMCYNIALGGYGGNIRVGLSENELKQWKNMQTSKATMTVTNN